MDWQPTIWLGSRLAEMACAALDGPAHRQRSRGATYIANEDIASWTGKLLNPDPRPADADSRKFQPDDVLFNKLRPYLAKVYHASFAGVSSGELLCLRGDDRVLPRYLFYVVSSKAFVDAINAETFGSKMPRADWATIGHQPLPLPSLEIQRGIVAFLDQKTTQVDALVEKKRTMLDRLAEKRQAIITEAVTRGLDPAAPMKDSGIDWLGQIPAHWETYLIKRKYAVSYGVGGEIDRGLDAGTKLLSLPNISKDGRLVLDEFPFTDNTDASLLLEPGDLLFNWRNGSAEHLGKTVLFDQSGNWTHVSFLLRIRATDESACTVFLRYFLNGMRKTGFFAYSKAGVNNTFNLFELRNLVVAAPPTRSEQELISKHVESDVSKIDSTSEVVEQSIDTLIEYRSTLITAAVTGQIEGLR